MASWLRYVNEAGQLVPVRLGVMLANRVDFGSPGTTRLRLYRAGIATTIRLRLYEAAFGGETAAPPRVRLYKAGIGGEAADPITFYLQKAGVEGVAV